MIIADLDYMPVYFQACKLASPVASGVDTFGLAFTLAPTGIIAGLSVAITQRFRPQLWGAWVFVVLGMGLLSTLHADTNRGRSIGYQIVTSVGLGAMSSTTFFPVLAPLPVSANAHALAFFTFVRFIGQVRRAASVRRDVPVVGRPCEYEADRWSTSFPLHHSHKNRFGASPSVARSSRMNSRNVFLRNSTLVFRRVRLSRTRLSPPSVTCN